ncbi:MAG: ribonuclease R [Candidatus Gracilibacteria bacterium]|nr:ribonuclease R [Candidatus Gracilibacteria bacterium]
MNNFKKEYTRREEPASQNIQKITGIYHQGKGDFGFVDLETEKKGFYVFPRNRNTAIDGDQVEAEVKSFKGRDEAVVTKILKRAEHIFIGTYEISKNFGFVRVDSALVQHDIFVAGVNSMRAKNGDKVIVKIMKWERKNPDGKITEILPDFKGNKGDLIKIVIESGLKLSFSPKVLEDVAKIAPKINQYENERRKNFRNLFTTTIDGITAKDLDDAISIEKLENGNHKLYVHIADVTHYVKEGSSLDVEALNRSTSTYYPSEVIPMLPEKLSNGLCSLNPNEDKLTLTACMEIGKTGEIINTEVYESIIKSNYRLTYDEVFYLLGDTKTLSSNELELQADITKKKQDKELLEFLQTANNLKKIIEQRKKMMGVLDFDFSEIKIEVNEEFKPIKISKYTRHFAHKIIEEFMIIANEAIGKKFSTTPFLYRIHRDPASEDIEKLQKMLHIFGIKFQLDDKISPKSLQLVLDEIKLCPKPEIVSKFVLRTLQKAIYSEVNEGHFGLALDHYSHFTSPIRRYPDLQIHRIIKEKINKKLDRERIKHYRALLPSVAQITSEKEEKSEKIEYKINDYLKAKFVEDKIGQTFSGTISGIIANGIFVELENYVEGMIRIENLGGNFLYDIDFMEMRDERTGKTYRLGDSLDIKIDRVSPMEGKIDFILA